MFNHIMIGANDINAAKTFYDAILGTLGVAPAKSTRKADASTVRIPVCCAHATDRWQPGDPRQWLHNRLQRRQHWGSRRMARSRTRQWWFGLRRPALARAATFARLTFAIHQAIKYALC